MAAGVGCQGQGCVIPRGMLAAETAAAGPPPRFRASADALLLPVLSIAASLALWELISRTNTISQHDLPAMSRSFRALWDLVVTGSVWDAFLPELSGGAVRLGI